MKVTAILKGSKDSLNRQPICIRIADGKTRKFKVTKFRVSSDQFDKKKMEVKSSVIGYKQMNKEIKEKLLNAEYGKLFPDDSQLPAEVSLSFL